jgi:phosphoserine aminotransferase
MVDSPVYNFSAGPCVLPKEVLKRAQDEMMDWHGSGLSVMEMSHRGKYFCEIAESARSDLRKLLNVPEEFQIYFFQGGATMQFSAICYNLLGEENCTANYLTTGVWSEGAIGEARKFGPMTEVANNKGDKYWNVAEHKDWKIDQNAKYFHYCENETI